MSDNSLRVQFDGTGGGFFGLLLKNLFLTVITLGIYWFWANVNIKRFHFEHTSVAGGRFGYHATGMERFLAFLKATLVLIGVGIVVQILLLIPVVGPIVAGILVIAGAILLPALLSVASMRYHMSRTSYRDIRFRFTGRPRNLFFIFLKGFFLTVITFGIYGPWFTVNLQRYYNRNTVIGNSTLDFTGNGKDLFFLYLKGFLLTIITLGIYYPWFIAGIIRYFVNNTSFQGTPMSSDLTGGSLFVKFLLAYLLVIFTLGIGTAWAIIMVQKLVLQSIQLGAAPDLTRMQQEFDAAANPLADGLADAAGLLDSIADFIS